MEKRTRELTKDKGRYRKKEKDVKKRIIKRREGKDCAGTTTLKIVIKKAKKGKRKPGNTGITGEK